MNFFSLFSKKNRIKNQRQTLSAENKHINRKHYYLEELIFKHFAISSKAKAM